jgi:hypothetical protein
MFIFFNVHLYCEFLVAVSAVSIESIKLIIIQSITLIKLKTIPVIAIPVGLCSFSTYNKQRL